MATSKATTTAPVTKMAVVVATENWFQKNQVLMSALAGALVIVLQQFIQEAVINPKALGLAVLMAIAGVIGNQFRGRGVSVAGFLGVAAYAFQQIYSTGHFTWGQFILAVVIGFLALVAPPPKNVAYEQSPIIQEAKSEAQTIVDAQDTKASSNSKPK